MHTILITQNTLYKENFRGATSLPYHILYGRDTHLDNNLVDRMNRYFSMSRWSSLFFGSHSGTERAAVLYTLALSAKKNGINLFEYIVVILDKTGTRQPITPLAK